MFQITLEAARVNAGLTQQEVAKILKISNTTLCNWETGKTKPSAKKIAELCKLYACPFDVLNFLPDDSV